MSGGYYAGALQFFVPTQLLAVIALGLLVGQRGRSWLIVVPTAFALGLAAGSFAIAFEVGETPASPVLLTMAAMAACLVVAGRGMPLTVSIPLAVITGTAIALNTPPHEITIRAAISAQWGTAIAALCTFAVAAQLSTHATRPWQRIGVRVVGSWIAASAILVLALRLAR